MATQIERKLEKLSQEFVGKREKKIPVFSVLKNNAILKNIFLINSPLHLPTSFSSPHSEEKNCTGIDKEEGLEEILLVGRHPDCNITLEHPSISRFHLRIHSIPSIQSLSVLDLSSVHGTRVSEKLIEPGIRIELQEGDTLQLGASTRVYKLHWVPRSRAYDMKNPFVPRLDDLEPVEERGEEIHTHENENGSCLQDDQTEMSDDYFEGLGLLFADMNVMSSKKQLTTSPTLMAEDTKSPFSFQEDTENKGQLREALQQSETDKLRPVWQLDIENCDLQVNFSSEMPQTFSQVEDPENPTETLQKRSGVSVWKRRGKSASVHIQTGRARENCTKADSGLEMASESNKHIITGSISEDLFAAAEEKMKSEFSVNYLVSSMDEKDEEAFTPDKENITSRTHLLRSMKKVGKLEEINYPKTYRCPLKNAGSIIHGEADMVILSDNQNQLSKLFREKKSENPAFSLARSEAAMSNAREDRVTFQSLLVNSRPTKSEASDLEGTTRSCKSVKNALIKKPIHSYFPP